MYIAIDLDIKETDMMKLLVTGPWKVKINTDFFIKSKESTTIRMRITLIFLSKEKLRGSLETIHMSLRHRL